MLSERIRETRYDQRKTGIILKRVVRERTLQKMMKKMVAKSKKKHEKKNAERKKY